MKKEDIIDWQDLAPLDFHLFSLIKEGLKGKHYPSDKEVKTAVKKWLKVQDYMVSFKIRTLPLRETVTMLKRRNVIHIGSVSFWCMIHVPVSVIIYVFKKKALLFDSRL